MVAKNFIPQKWLLMVLFAFFCGGKTEALPFCARGGCMIKPQATDEDSSEKKGSDCQQKICPLSDKTPKEINKAIQSGAESPAAEEGAAKQTLVVLQSEPRPTNPSPGLTISIWGPPGGTPSTINSGGMMGEFGF